jgi:hypothetical protein
VNTLRRERLVDELLEAYIGWRETCVRVNDAYRSWTGETGPHARVAFELYAAALDAEQRAADVYAGLVRRADEVPWSEDPPDEPVGGRASGAGWQ